MLVLQIGLVINGRLVPSVEDSFVQSEKQSLVKRFMNLELNNEETAVLINKKSGGIIRKGKFFDLNTIKTII